MRIVRGIALLPRNIIIALLRVYRAIVSPLYGDVCRYYPSCSAYGLTAVQEHGVLKGGWMTARRLARCHPWAAGGIDDVPPHEHSPYRRSRFGFMVLERKG
jgi:putative membrane protein insertion efficiency factor